MHEALLQRRFTNTAGSMISGAQTFIGMMFSGLFLTLSLSLAGLAIYEFSSALFGEKSLATELVRPINFAVISLALFELGIGIRKEYAHDDETMDIFGTVRRSVTRFVAVVCVALVLEALIMVVKYSQLELAGNLYYPVAIVVAAALLLISLGAFLHLTVSSLAIASALGEVENLDRETAKNSEAPARNRTHHTPCLALGESQQARRTEQNAATL